MKEAEFAVILRSNPLFQDFAPAAIDQLARMCSLRVVREGATLFHKGDLGDALYGVRRGRLAIETESESGMRVTLAILGSGDLFGEIALLDGKGRTASVCALERSELFALKRADVLAYLAREPQVGIAMIEMLCRRLRLMSDQVEHGMMLKLDARLALSLAGLSDNFGDEIEITQERLARTVGATRESVNRQLRAWETLGWLEIKRGRILIKDGRALRATSP